MSFFNICKDGDMTKVLDEMRFDTEYFFGYSVLNGLAGACEGGHKEIIELMIEKGASNFNQGLSHACSGGHIEIVELMISKGANDFARGLKVACNHNHKDIISLMLKKGNNTFTFKTWNKILEEACRNGYKEIVELSILNGADDFDSGLRIACAYGHIDLVKLMILHSPTGTLDFNDALIEACDNDHNEIVLLLIEKGGDLNLNNGLKYVSFINKTLVFLLIEKGANIDICRARLTFDDIYYLFQKGVKHFGKYEKIYEQCKAVKALFFDTTMKLMNPDVVNLVISY